MYQTISQLPEEVLGKIQKTQEEYGIIVRDATEEDFKKVICSVGKKPFTKENLILEISKLDSFPNYTLIPDEDSTIHVTYYGRDLSPEEAEQINKIMTDVFGVVNCE